MLLWRQLLNEIKGKTMTDYNCKKLGLDEAAARVSAAIQRAINSKDEALRVAADALQIATDNPESGGMINHYSSEIHEVFVSLEMAVLRADGELRDVIPKLAGAAAQAAAD